MGKLENLVQKREEEVINEERTRNKDLENESSATANGIIGIFKGAFGSLLIAFITTSVVAMILYWTTGYEGSLTLLIFIAIICIGAYLGFEEGYKEIRRKIK